MICQAKHANSTGKRREMTKEREEKKALTGCHDCTETTDTHSVGQKLACVKPRYKGAMHERVWLHAWSRSVGATYSHLELSPVAACSVMQLARDWRREDGSKWVCGQMRGRAVSWTEEEKRQARRGETGGARGRSRGRHQCRGEE